MSQAGVVADSLWSVVPVVSDVSLRLRSKEEGFCDLWILAYTVEPPLRNVRMERSDKYNCCRVGIVG